jgi:chromate reductase
MDNRLKVLGIVGSLRKGSYNKALMQAATELLPRNAAIEVVYLAEFPPFNQDLEHTPPEVVKQFKAKIHSTDAILIASPEYNYSSQGVLKNAIDWGSRPHGENAFDGKPVAVMSASIGKFGGARMQYHLRQVFVYLNMYPINRPEFMLPNCARYFDKEGNLMDEDTRQRIQELLAALSDWTLKPKIKLRQS